MHPTQSRNITGEVTHHTVAMALRYPYHGPRRLSKLLRRDRICLTASSVNIILRQNNLRSRLKRIERAKNLAEEDALTRSREAKIAEKIDLTKEPSYTKKPVVVWMKPRTRWQQGLFSPLLWGKWMVHLALVIIALSTGFYAAQYQHRTAIKIKEISSRVPIVEDSLLLSSDSPRVP